MTTFAKPAVAPEDLWYGTHRGSMNTNVLLQHVDPGQVGGLPDFVHSTSMLLLCACLHFMRLDADQMHDLPASSRGESLRRTQAIGPGGCQRRCANVCLADCCQGCVQLGIVCTRLELLYVSLDVQ